MDRVPYSQSLHKGSNHVIVIAYRTAMANAGIIPRPKTAIGRNSHYMGPVMARGASAIQKKMKLPQTGSIGPHVHNWLARPRKGMPNGYFTVAGVKLLRAAAHVRAVDAIRMRGVAIAKACLYHPAWRYSGPGSPTIGLRCEGVRRRLMWPENDQHEDCSSTSMFIIGAAVGYNVAICDPNRNGWAAWGSTETLKDSGPRVAWNKCKPLTFHFYGRTHITHMNTDIGGGLANNFGGEPYPVLRKILYRPDYQYSVDPLANAGMAA